MRKAKLLHYTIAHYATNIHTQIMDFHELTAFVVLSETLHFAHAAARIHMSPSALSRLISRLEEELGTTLISRDTRSVSLTREGETFLDFARRAVRERSDLEFKLTERDDQLRGILRVYASVTACYSILPPFAEALKREHPLLRLSVDTGDPAGAADAIREGRVELGLAALPPGGFPDLDCHSVQKTPLVFVTSATGSYANLSLPRNGIAPTGGQTETLEDILSFVPVILPKSGLARERFDRWSRTSPVKPGIAAETAGNEAILALARLGLGLGLVPRLVLENGPFAEGLIQYDAGPDFGDYDIGFVQKRGGSGGPAQKRLREAVSEIILRIYPE